MSISDGIVWNASLISGSKFELRFSYTKRREEYKHKQYEYYFCWHIENVDSKNSILPTFDQQKLKRTYTPLARSGIRETNSLTITKDDMGDKYINQYKVIQTIGRLV